MNSSLKNSSSVVIRMLESSSCGIESNELDYDDDGWFFAYEDQGRADGLHARW